MILPIIASLVLAATAAFDGYETSKAQAKGGTEDGPAYMLYGPHPTNKDLILKGGAVILAEIAVVLLWSALDHEQYVSLVVSIPILVQSVFHIIGGLSGIRFVKSAK